MASVTLADFRLRSRERADMVNSRFITDAELNRYVNASIQELYDLLIASRGESYYISSYTFNTANGTADYALPATFLKLMGVDLNTSTNQAVTLKSFKWQERNQAKGPYYIQYQAALRYQIRGGNLTFSPTPQGAQSITLWFIPRAVVLTADGDSFDGINGWEEYVIIDCAIKMRVKEESPVQELMIAKQDMLARVLQASSARDSGEPPRVVDSDSYNSGLRAWN